MVLNTIPSKELRSKERVCLAVFFIFGSDLDAPEFFHLGSIVVFGGRRHVILSDQVPVFTFNECLTFDCVESESKWLRTIQ